MCHNTSNWVQVFMQYFGLLHLLFIFFAFVGYSKIECIEKRLHCQPMTTSVFIPCYYKHFNLLPDLLGYYLAQTVYPDEIVISLSESDKVDSLALKALKERNWPFTLKIICNVGKCTAGKNRNIACENSIGDLMISQDADDIPHPQRIEIIKYLFENYKIDHLMHSWIKPGSSFPCYETSKIDLLCKCYNNLDDTFRYEEYVHYGNNAYTRAVFEKIKWPEYPEYWADAEFDKMVYQAFKYKVLVKADLVIYRNELSSFAQMDK